MKKYAIPGVPFLNDKLHFLKLNTRAVSLCRTDMQLVFYFAGPARHIF